MKTAHDMLDRLEALARRVAGEFSTDRPIIPEGLICFQAVEEARAIVAELPEPVDPDRAVVAELLKETARYVPRTDEEWTNRDRAGGLALAALKKGRELERAGK